MKPSLPTAAFWLAVLLHPRLSAAEEPTSAVAACAHVERRTVVACALASSPALLEELALQRAAVGRREAARPFLPSNPVLGGSLGARSAQAERALNWNLSLGQELEVAGQRGLRVDVAEGELRAQAQRLTAARAAIAADAWRAWFRALAARERLELAARLETATSAVATTVRAMASGGLASDVDADVADAAATRATQDRLTLEGVASAAVAELALLTGAQPSDVPGGALEPLSGADAATRTATTRAEVRALEESRAALERHVELLRRARVPNPTVSLFAQKDGFNEQVLGIGLSLPIPLPQPVGRTLAGEIAESTALGDRALAETERTKRAFQAELVAASAEYGAAVKARQLYTPALLARAVARLDSIAAQVRAARLPVRDALVAQQALVDQLKADIDARETLCLASVRLTRAAGASLEGDSQ